MENYPVDFPLAQALEIVSIVRQKKVKERMPVFAYDLWLLQGYTMRTVIGDPLAPPKIPAIPTATPNGGDAGVLIPDFTLFSATDPVATLEKLCDQYQNNAITAQTAVPWLMLLNWALDELSKLIAENI